MVSIWDSATDELIIVTEALPLPIHKGRQLQITIAAEARIVQYLYYVDTIDNDNKRVYVTLQKVYLDDAIIVN